MILRKIPLIAVILSIFLFLSCSLSHNHQLGKEEFGELTIRKFAHDKFHYLEIKDKKQTFRFIYPVGDENLSFGGGPGPIYRAKKYDKTKQKDFYVITDNTRDSVCFLNYCHDSNGSFIEFNQYDKELIQQIDSFCRRNYAFYKIDIKRFSKWYLPN